MVKKQSSPEEIVKWIADNRFKQSEKMSGGFVIDEDNKKIINDLFLYFTRDKKFDGDLDNGIALIGGVGLGKSLLFKIFNVYLQMKNPLENFGIFSSRELVLQYDSDGSNVIREHIEGSYRRNGVNRIPLHRLYDDIGTETLGFHYKTVNVMETICCGRWDKDYRLITHISANLGLVKLEEIYGQRFISRIKKHTNCYILTGKNRRNTK